MATPLPLLGGWLGVSAPKITLKSMSILLKWVGGWVDRGWLGPKDLPNPPYSPARSIRSRQSRPAFYWRL